MRKKVLVTGGSGLVGSSIKRLSRSYDYDFSFLNGRRDGFDLTKEGDVQKIFALYRPSYVIHCAAKVGGVKDNLEFQADFYYENLLINIHMIHYAVIHKVEKFFAFCSNCIFADGEILRESNIHKGEPFRGTRGYAYAKRMVDVQIDTCKDQHMVQNYCSLIPGNIFGENDFFNLESGHAIPSLIHKLYRAKKNREALTVWGDGSSVREFLYVDDLSKIVLELLGQETVPSRLLISGEHSYSIKEIIEALCEVSNFNGKVIYDTKEPNGQAARKSDPALLRSLFPDFEFTDIKQSLRKTYEWFEKNYPNIRK